MTVKRIPARGEIVEVTLTFTKEEWDKISTSAAWDYGGATEAYIKACALGWRKRGC